MVLVIYVQQMDNKDTTIIIHINTQSSGCHAYHIEEQKLLPVFLKSAMVGNYTPTVAPGAANYQLGNNQTRFDYLITKVHESQTQIKEPYREMCKGTAIYFQGHSLYIFGGSTNHELQVCNNCRCCWQRVPWQ